MYFTVTAHLNSNAQFSLEIFDMYLDIHFTVGKVDSHTLVAQSMLTSFLVMELII